MESPGLFGIVYLAVFGLLYFIYREVNLASNDPLAFTKNLMSNMYMIVLPVVVVFMLVSLLAFDGDFSTALIGGSIAIAVIVGTGVYFLQTNLSQYIFNKYLLYIVIAILILVALSIIATLFSGTLRKLSGWAGFVVNFLFFIPCLIRDMIHGAIQEYQTFSTTLIILFVIELILLMTYFFLIPFVNTRIFPTTTVLLDDPVMLNMPQSIDLPPDLSNNFALSMWVYINPGSPNKPGYAVESPIYSFMTKDGDPHLRISYSNVDQGNNDFNIYIGKQMYKISLPLQKWNHFVFNYATYPYGTPSHTTAPVVYSTTPPPLLQTTVDVFINGNLERSFTYPSDIPVFSIYDQMYVGSGDSNRSSIHTARDGVESSNGSNSNKDGLYGSICNVNYFSQPLTKMAIIYHYNLYTIRNPPV